MTEKKRNDPFRAFAKYLENSLLLFRADAMAQIESPEDEFFWRSVISAVKPNLKIRFISAQNGEKDGVGKETCLKYVPYCNSSFFVCIDSDFNSFLRCFSRIVYQPLINLLAAKSSGLRLWKLDDMCSLVLRIQVNNAELLQNDGAALLSTINNHLLVWMSALPQPSEADIAKIRQKTDVIGMNRDNTYLYMQGHCVYNLVNKIGKFLCYKASVNFKQQVLDQNLSVGRYNEIREVYKDLMVI